MNAISFSRPSISSSAGGGALVRLDFAGVQEAGRGVAGGFSFSWSRLELRGVDTAEESVMIAVIFAPDRLRIARRITVENVSNALLLILKTVRRRPGRMSKKS